MANSTSSINTLSTELLDLIFEFTSSSFSSLHALSLVSKSFNSLSHRHLYRSIYFDLGHGDGERTAEKILQLGKALSRDDGRLGKLVRRLEIDNTRLYDERGEEDDGDMDCGLEKVEPLYEWVTNLEVLKIRVIFKKNWSEGNLKMRPLGSVRELDVTFSRCEDADYYPIIRQIIALSPRITSLSLCTEADCPNDFFRGDDRVYGPPLDVPFLRKLVLHDWCTLCEFLGFKHLVTMSTLKAINNLTLDFDTFSLFENRERGLVTRYLDIMGPQIRTLDSGGSRGGFGSFLISDLFSSCPNIKSIIVSPSYSGLTNSLSTGLATLPPRLNDLTIRYHEPGPYDDEEEPKVTVDEIVRFFTHDTESEGGRLRSSCGITTVRIDKGHLKSGDGEVISEELREELVGMGVRIVVFE